MAEKQQEPQVQDPLESPEPGEGAPASWWRRPRTLVAAVAGLAVLALGLALFAPDRAEDLVGERGEGTGATPAEDDPEETADEDATRASEADGDVGPDDGDGPGATPRQDPDPQARPGTAPGDPQGTTGGGEAELPNLDISPAAFRDRWNAAVGDLGRGYPLDEIVIDDPDFWDQPSGETLEYPVEQPIEGLGLITVRIRPDGLVSSVVVDGEPTGAEQDDYFATFAAAVAAVTDLGAQEAVELLASDLGLDDTADPASHVGGTQVGDVVIQVEAASGLWSFYVGGPWTS